MPGAIIAIDQDQGAPSFGSPGVARNDLRLGRLITLRSTASGNISYAWSILDKPPGSAVTLGTPDQQNATFTPDMTGSYRIQLVTNGGGPGNVQILIVAVTKDFSGVVVGRGWRIPALGEVAPENNFSGQARSWDEAIRFILTDMLASIYPPGGVDGQVQYRAAGPAFAGMAVSYDPITKATTYTDGLRTITEKPVTLTTTAVGSGILDTIAIAAEDIAAISFFVTMVSGTTVTRGGSWQGTAAYRLVTGNATIVGGAPDYSTPRTLDADDQVTLVPNAGNVRLQVATDTASQLLWFGSVRVQRSKAA